MIAYVFSVATLPPFLISIALGILKPYTAIDPPRWLQLGLMVLSILAPWWLAQKDIKLSTRITSLIELSTICLIVLMFCLFFRHNGTIVDRPQISLDGFSPNQFHLGLVLAFLCFGGFETAAELGAEARRPFIVIPRVLFFVVGFTGTFFVFSSYSVVAVLRFFGPLPETELTPLPLLAHFLNADWLGTLALVGICFSLLASSLGCINAAGRVLYALAHRGLVYRRLGASHSRNATPHFSIALVSLAALTMTISMVLGGLSLADIISYVGGIASFGFLFAYLLVAIAAPVDLKKRGTLRWYNIALAALTAALLLIPIAGSLYPVPEWPASLLPYIYFGLLLAGIGCFFYVRKTDPGRLQVVEEELLETTG